MSNWWPAENRRKRSDPVDRDLIVLVYIKGQNVAVSLSYMLGIVKAVLLGNVTCGYHSTKETLSYAGTSYAGTTYLVFRKTDIMKFSRCIRSGVRGLG